MVLRLVSALTCFFADSCSYFAPLSANFAQILYYFFFRTILTQNCFFTFVSNLLRAAQQNRSCWARKSDRSEADQVTTLQEAGQETFHELIISNSKTQWAQNPETWTKSLANIETHYTNNNKTLSLGKTVNLSTRTTHKFCLLNHWTLIKQCLLLCNRLSHIAHMQNYISSKN